MLSLTKRLFTKEKAMLLGRWATVINKDTDLNNIIDWANHDHCGGELCRIPDIEKRLEEIDSREKKLETKGLS